MITKVISALSFLLLSFQSQALYQPLYQNILDENFDQLRTTALKALREKSTVQHNRSVLKALLSQEKFLYDIQSFDSKIIPFNEGGCLAGALTPEVCGAHYDYSFLLQDQAQGQILILKKSNLEVFRRPTKSRLQLIDSKLKFGTVVHLIRPIRSQTEFFFLVREIEHLEGDPQRVTINIFKVSDQEACQIAESDFTVTYDHYELFSVFVRALGHQISCQDEVLKI